MKILEKIRNRVFSRIILKGIVEDLKKDFIATLENFWKNGENAKILEKSKNTEFLQKSTELKKSAEFQKNAEQQLSLEKITIKAINEIHLEEYQGLLKLPEAFRKKLQVGEEKMEIEDEEILKNIERILKEKEENQLFRRFEMGVEDLRELMGIERKEQNNGIYLKIEVEIKKFAEILIIARIKNDYPFEFFSLIS